MRFGLQPVTRRAWTRRGVEVVLPVEPRHQWGGLINEIQRSGFTVGIRDTMIAASAKHHGLTVATRNVEDFRRCGVDVVNAFE